MTIIIRLSQLPRSSEIHDAIQHAALIIVEIIPISNISTLDGAKFVRESNERVEHGLAAGRARCSLNRTWNRDGRPESL